MGLQLVSVGAGTSVGWCWCQLGCGRWLEAAGGLRGATGWGNSRARQDWGRLGGDRAKGRRGDEAEDGAG